MRVLVAGATGALGRPLVRLLTHDGHDVIALARRAASTPLENGRVAPLPCDLLSGEAVPRIEATKPDVIIHAATALSSSLLNPLAAWRSFARTNALRQRGTTALAAAARTSGARLISASVAFAYPPGTEPRDESDSLWTHARGLAGSINRALHALEQTTSATGGTVLRFGSFHGPGTYYAPDGAFIQMIRRRMLPLIDGGGGVYTFLHVDDAARAVAAALDAAPGIYNVADVRSALPAREWITLAANAIGAKPPRQLPRWVADHGPGTLLTYMLADQPPVTTARAERDLAWTPQEPPWQPSLLSPS